MIVYFAARFATEERLMDTLIIVEGYLNSELEKKLSLRGYVIGTKYYQITILQKQDYTFEHGKWLERNGLSIKFTTAIKEEEVIVNQLPPIPWGTYPNYPDGRYGGQALQFDLAHNPDIPILVTAVTVRRELVIRRIEDVVHIVYAKKGFCYIAIDYHDFIKLKGASAFRLVELYLADIERGDKKPIQYISISANKDYQFMSYIMNWHWRL